jgi:hypothetical protein
VSGIPALTVELNGPLGWADISALVLKDQGLTMKRGRSSEFDTSSPGTLSLTLRNDDPLNQWGIGGNVYDDWGYLKKNLKIRVKVGSTQVWQGRVDSWVSKPGRAKGGSVVELTATDDFKSYARAQLYPFAVETCKADVAWTGGAVYPQLEKIGGVGSYLAAHRDPAASRARIWSGSVGGREYNEDGPPHIKRAMKIIPRGQIGPVLEHPTTWDPTTVNGLVSLWFRTEAQETAYLFSMERTSGGTGYFQIWIDGTTGRITFAAAGDSGGSITATPSGVGADDLFDGDWHHVAAWLHPKTGGTELRYYIDGVLLGTQYSATATTIGSSNRRAVFGGKRNSAWTDNSFSLNGDIACPAIWTASSVSDAPANWYDDGMLGGPGSQTVTNQLTGLASFVGAATPATANLSGYDVAGQDTYKRSLLDCYQELAESELGVFYCDRLGDPKFRGYGARSSGSSVTLTVSATQDLTADVSLVLDDATYANTVRAESPAGSVIRHDSSLVTADGLPIVDEWKSLIEDETELQTHADNRLAMRKSNKFRLGKIVVDLLTSPNAIESTALQLVPLDRVRVNALDADMFGATTFDGFVEGWELNVSTDTYTVALDLSPVI